MKKFFLEALQVGFLWFLCSSSIGMIFILIRFVVFRMKVVDIEPHYLLDFFIGGLAPAIYMYVSLLKNEKKKEREFEQKLNTSRSTQ